jgi:hypothetical protein
MRYIGTITKTLVEELARAGGDLELVLRDEQERVYTVVGWGVGKVPDMWDLRDDPFSDEDDKLVPTPVRSSRAFILSIALKKGQGLEDYPEGRLQLEQSWKNDHNRKIQKAIAEPAGKAPERKRPPDSNPPTAKKPQSFMYDPVAKVPAAAPQAKTPIRLPRLGTKQEKG